MFRMVSLLSPDSWKAMNFLIIWNGTGEVIKGKLLSLSLAVLLHSWFQMFLTRTTISPFQLPCFILIDIHVNRKNWKAYLGFMLCLLSSKEGFPQLLFWIFFLWQPGGFYALKQCIILCIGSMEGYAFFFLWKGEDRKMNLQDSKKEQCESWVSENRFP